MKTYSIEATCLVCKKTWQRNAQIEEMNVKAEAMTFLAETASGHQHDLAGQWQVTWDVID
jgi:hypothetical protein